MWGAASFSHSILGEVGQRIVDVSHGLFGSQISLLFRLEPKSGELMALAASGATEPQPLGPPEPDRRVGGDAHARSSHGWDKAQDPRKDRVTGPGKGA